VITQLKTGSVAACRLLECKQCAFGRVGFGFTPLGADGKAPLDAGPPPPRSWCRHWFAGVLGLFPGDEKVARAL